MSQIWSHAAGIAYTVINPGGLIDKPGGERELVVGKRVRCAVRFLVTAIATCWMEMIVWHAALSMPCGQYSSSTDP